MSRTAWHVGEELLIADIGPEAQAAAQEELERQTELERAWQSEEHLKGILEIPDSLAAARAVHRTVKARKAEAVELRYGNDPQGAEQARELLKETYELVLGRLTRVRVESEREAEMVLLLALGELNCRHRQPAPRNEAMEVIERALSIARELGEKREEGEALVLLAIAAQDSRGEFALKQATAAQGIFNSLGDKVCEGQATHLMGVATFWIQMWHNGFRHMEKAAQLFREAGAKRHEALENFAMADLSSLQPRRFAKAPCAGLALSMFEKWGYDRGFEVNARRCKVESLRHDMLPHAQTQAREELEKLKQQGDVRATKAQLDLKHVIVLSYAQERRYEEAVQTAEDMLFEVREFNNPEWEILVCRLLMRVNIERLDVEQAETYMNLGRQTAQEAGDDVAEWQFLDDWIMFMQGRGSCEEAMDIAVHHSEEQRKNCERTGDEYRYGMSLLRLCLVWGQSARPNSRFLANALKCAREASDIFRGLGESRAEASAWDKMAQSYIIEFDDKPMEPEKALEAAERGRSLHRQRGDVHQEARMLVRVFCRIHTDSGRHAEAAEVGEQARKLAMSLADPWLLVEILSRLFQLRLDQLHGVNGPPLEGKQRERAIRKALKEAKEAFQRAVESRDRLLEGYTACRRASLELSCGNPNAASSLIDRTMKLGIELYDYSLQANATRLQAEVCWMSGDFDNALWRAEKALALAQMVEDEDAQEAVHQLLFVIERGLAGEEPEAPQEAWDERHAKPESSFQEEAWLPPPPVQKAAPPPVQKAAQQQPREARARRSVDTENLMRTAVETAISNLGIHHHVDYDMPLLEAMDSLHVVRLRNQLKQMTTLELPSVLIYDCPSQRAIVGLLVEESDRRAAEGQRPLPHRGPAPELTSGGGEPVQVLG